MTKRYAPIPKTWDGPVPTRYRPLRSVVADDTKTCTKCGRTRSLSKFTLPDSQTSDFCDGCRKAHRMRKRHA